MAEVNNLLHTWASHYLQDFNLNLPKRQSKMDDDIIHLQNIERVFYKKFGANDYEEFITKIRSIYNPKDTQSLKDRECIERFASDKLKGTLLRIEGQKNISGSTIEVNIKIDQTQLVNIKDRIIANLKKTDKYGNTKIHSTISEDWGYHAKFEFNRESILQFIYEIQGTKAQRGKNTYKTIEKDLYKFLDSNLANMMTLKVDGFEIDDNPIDIFKYSFQRNARTYPWGFTFDELKKAAKEHEEQSKLYLEVSQAWHTIKDYVFNVLLNGASNILIKSAEATWNKIMGATDEPKSFISNMSFFSAGSGGFFTNAVVGALGEFQFDMIFEYVKRKLQAMGVSSEIIGNIIGTENDARGIAFGEKGKTDIEIFTGQTRIGVQIKNYNVFNTVNSINTKIHPDKFADLADLQGVYRGNFLTFLANYYFNITFQKEQSDNMLQLMEFVRQEAAALMSFDVSRELKMTDSITFYFIGGRFLLPASIILKCIQETEQQEKRVLGNIVIRGKGTNRGSTDNNGTKPVDGGLTDDEFHAHAGGNMIYDEKNILSFASPFKYYWNYDESTKRYTKPSSKNKTEFNNLVNKHLSFNTNFNYKKILGEKLENWEKYSII